MNNGCVPTQSYNLSKINKNICAIDCYSSTFWLFWVLPTVAVWMLPSISYARTFYKIYDDVLIFLRGFTVGRIRRLGVDLVRLRWLCRLLERIAVFVVFDVFVDALKVE